MDLESIRYPTHSVQGQHNLCNLVCSLEKETIENCMHRHKVYIVVQNTPIRLLAETSLKSHSHPCLVFLLFAILQSLQHFITFFVTCLCPVFSIQVLVETEVKKCLHGIQQNSNRLHQFRN